MILKLTRLLLLLWSATATAEESRWAPAFSVGDPMPAIEMIDSNGETIQLQNLYGEKGLLLFFNRSTVW